VVVEKNTGYTTDIVTDKALDWLKNDWTLDYGDAGRESIRRFLRRGHEMGVVPALPKLEFVE